MDFSLLLGKTLQSITVSPDKDEILMVDATGDRYMLTHMQDCCENVVVEDICGELEHLIGSPLVQAEESSNEQDDNGEHESATWTFYKLATEKGYVTIRWLGTSNGYYSESVDFFQILDDRKIEYEETRLLT